MQNGIHGRTGKSFSWLVIGLLLLQPPIVSYAQVTNITPSGLNTTVSPPIENITTITGGTRAGTNLFHSFGDFSIGTGDIANFSNLNSLGLPGGLTDNILSRVTGGNESKIFGTLQVDQNFGNANLFLMNPAGIIFGDGARLNIAGSFHATSADFIRLVDDVEFRFDGTTDGVLSAALPKEFGFLQVNPNIPTIQIEEGSDLSVENGRTSTLR